MSLSEKSIPLVAGNWKMNGDLASLPMVAAISEYMTDNLQTAAGNVCDVMLLPPFTLISRCLAQIKDSPLIIGAQDCHYRDNGAYTGDISASMLVDIGAGAVIVGHSERRTLYGESNVMIRDKAKAAVASGLYTIVCVGESAEERKAGLATRVITHQLRYCLPQLSNYDKLAIAYEPVWAIGSGTPASLDDITLMHKCIRDYLVTLLPDQGGGVRILYGGSVKPDNAASIAGLPEVNGALVGGASLKASDFIEIIKAYAS